MFLLSVLQFVVNFPPKTSAEFPHHLSSTSLTELSLTVWIHASLVTTLFN